LPPTMLGLRTASGAEVEEIDSSGVRPDSLVGGPQWCSDPAEIGAAMKRALELRGAAVYAMARSEMAATCRERSGRRRRSGRVARLRERVSKEQGRLDFLICNACPPILSLRLEQTPLNASVHISTRQCLSLSCRSPSSGAIEPQRRLRRDYFIRSVEHPVREWPHYLAAKRAVEMLGCVASLQYRRPYPHRATSKTTHCHDQHTNGRGAASRAACQPHRRTPGRSTAPGKTESSSEEWPGCSCFAGNGRQNPHTNVP